MLEPQNSNHEKKMKSHKKIWITYPGEIYPKISPKSDLLFPHTTATFHKNMRVFLTIAQLFGLLPISGIHGPTSEALRYSFCGFRNFYSIFIIAGNLTIGVIYCYWNIVTGYTFNKLFPLIWFSMNPFLVYRFIWIARHWPSLMQHWETFEMTFTQKNPEVQKQMRTIIITTSVAMPILALLEHAFSLGNNLNTASMCKMSKDTMDAYFTAAFPGYFYFFKVNYVNGISVQILNLFATFVWSITDTFIVLISLGLITQFRHFNKHFERFKGVHVPPDFIGKQRTYFTKLTELLDHVNKDLAVLIFISYAINTFYICVQLFESGSPTQSTIRRIYFWYSLTYLIFKTLLVSMTAMLVNDEAKKPTKVLEMVPASVYGSEAARFMDQLTSGTIALGGMRFFYITRKFLISMVGTIVTYEIVLMQFQRQKDKNYDPCKG